MYHISNDHNKGTALGRFNRYMVSILDILGYFNNK